jgi:hypothetical protein
VSAREGAQPAGPDIDLALRRVMATRFFPVAWYVEKTGGFVVRDPTGQALVFLRTRPDEADARQAKVLTAAGGRKPTFLTSCRVMVSERSDIIGWLQNFSGGDETSPPPWMLTTPFATLASRRLRYLLGFADRLQVRIEQRFLFVAPIDLQRFFRCIVKTARSRTAAASPAPTPARP